MSTTKDYEDLGREFLQAWEMMMLRNAQNLSQKELAEMAGTSQPTIAALNPADSPMSPCPSSWSRVFV